MSPCQNCHAGCCRSFAIPVSGADIIRIEQRLDLSFWDFACRWADPEGSIAQKYAPHFRFPDEPEIPFVITLLQRESDVFPETRCCTFLSEGEPDEQNQLGVSHCGIYESRPAACRVFPTKFNDSGELAVIHDVPLRESEGEDALYELCPRQWEPEDLDPVQPLHNLVTARYEMEFFHRLAALWNRDPKPWSVFPDFLRMVYTRRVTKETLIESVPEPEADDEPCIIPFPAQSPAEETVARAA